MMIFEQRTFVKRWQANLQDAQRNSSKFESLWRGKKTVAALQRRGLLRVAQFERDDDLEFRGRADWRTSKLLEELEGAAAAYETVAVKRSQISLVEQTIARIKTLEKGFREDSADQSPMKPVLKALRRFKRDLENRMAFGKLGPWKRHLRKALPLPNRSADIDSWFQKIVGFIFRMFLQEPKVSQQTICSLVVLFYISAGFVLTLRAPLRARLNPTKITLHSVGQNLSRGHLKRIV